MELRCLLETQSRWILLEIFSNFNFVNVHSCKWCAISILFLKKEILLHTKILCNSLNNNKNSSIAWSFFAKIDDFRATKLALDKEHCEYMEMKVQSEFLIASTILFIVWNLFFIVMIIKLDVESAHIRSSQKFWNV